MSNNQLEVTLSEPQRLAIEHFKGPMMVLAGPGSGKTFVITRRIRCLIKNYKVNPENILVITFTKNSAVEMQERFESLMDNDYLPVNFGTFHSIFFNILKESFGYTTESIISEKEKYELLKISILDNNNDNKIIDFEFIPLILSEISRLKNSSSPKENVNISNIDKHLLSNIINSYLENIKSLKKIDFDDMIIECLSCLKNNENELNYWQHRYQYILIDEFQDINQVQYDVIKLLAKNNNLFVVGDDDQSIYSFRGSRPDIMLGFPNEYKNCKKVLLNTNYRCNEDIVKKAVELINHNSKRFSKDIIAQKKSNKKVVLMHFDSIDKQNQKIIDLIKIAKRKSIYSDIAIIYRTNNAARCLTKCLTDNKIPYSIKENIKSIFKTSTATTILAILSFAYGEKTRSNFIKFMNKPVRYIPRNIITDEFIDFDKLINLSKSKQYLTNNVIKLKYEIEQIAEMDIYQAIIFIKKHMLLEDYLINEAQKNNKDDNEIKEIFNMMQDFAKGIINYNDYLAVIEKYEQALLESRKEDSEDKVNIITMHASKGLEYKTVIIPDITEGYIPQPKAITQDEIEEERRMFYVAMTRAKDNLFLFYSSRYKERTFKRSRFINDIHTLEDIEG